MEPIIKVDGLSHVYSPNTPFRHVALDNIDLEIYPGEYLGIIGQTGSGKSTLIQHLNGLLKPTSGRISYNGSDIAQNSALSRQLRFHVGLVFQYPEYQLFEETVYQDIAFGPKNMKLNAEEIDRRVRAAAQFVGLSDSVLERSPFDLSGGQKRRVAIAGVIAMEPKVLILDEPTAGLDPVSVESILQNIEDYHREKGATVIVVSHSMDEIARIANRLIVFHQGKIPLSGTPEEVFPHSKQLEELGLGVPKMAKVFSRLRAMGLDLDPSVYTIDQAKEAFLSAYRGKKEGM